MGLTLVLMLDELLKKKAGKERSILCFLEV